MTFKNISHLPLMTNLMKIFMFNFGITVAVLHVVFVINDSCQLYWTTFKISIVIFYELKYILEGLMLSICVTNFKAYESQKNWKVVKLVQVIWLPIISSVCTTLSKYKCVNCGVHQVLILGSLLFILYWSDITELNK